MLPDTNWIQLAAQLAVYWLVIRYIFAALAVAIVVWVILLDRRKQRRISPRRKNMD